MGLPKQPVALAMSFIFYIIMVIIIAAEEVMQEIIGIATNPNYAGMKFQAVNLVLYLSVPMFLMEEAFHALERLLMDTMMGGKGSRSGGSEYDEDEMGEEDEDGEGTGRKFHISQLYGFHWLRPGKHKDDGDDSSDDSDSSDGEDGGLLSGLTGSGGAEADV